MWDRVDWWLWLPLLLVLTQLRLGRLAKEKDHQPILDSQPPLLPAPRLPLQ